MPPTDQLLQQAFQAHTASRLPEAASLYQAVLQQDPLNPDALHLLGVVEYQSGRATRAIELITQAINTRPHVNMYGNLGAAYVAVKQFEQALACYNQGVRLAPTNAEVYYNRGNVFKSMGRTVEAIGDFRECLRLNPRQVQAYNNLGTALIERGQLAEAQQSYEQAIQIQPDYAKAHANLGWIHQKLGRPAEAQAAYQRAIQLQPNYALAYNNLASLFFEQNQADAALTAYEKALSLDSTLYDAAAGMGAVLSQQGKTAEARASYERALAIKPNDGLRVRMALLTYIVPYDEREMVETRARLEKTVDELVSLPLKIDDAVQEVGITPFYLAYQGLNEVPLQQKLSRLLYHASPALEFTSPHCRAGVVTRAPGRKPRIGFLSKYFYDHPVGKHYAGMMKALRHDQFHLVALKTVGPVDAVSRQIDAAADQQVTLDFQLDRARQQIAALELDVLIYTDLGMDPWTNYLAFSRLAPVQCVLGGHPVTTGLPTIDYFISSKLLEPDNAQEHYSERVVLLENLPNYYQRPKLPEPRKTLAQLGLPENVNRYVTNQTLFKYHPADDDLFGQILRADPNGRLLIFGGRHANWTRLMQERLGRHLPDVIGRIHFLPRMLGPDYLQVFAAADCILDTLRFSGGTTSCDALGVGGLVVTLPGPFMRSRVTHALYRKMGMDDLVARDRDDYVRIALRLGTDPTYRDQMRQKINSLSDVLFENTECASELGELFEKWTGK